MKGVIVCAEQSISNNLLVNSVNLENVKDCAAFPSFEFLPSHHKFRIKFSMNIVEQTVSFYFFKRPERYNKEVLSHSFICVPLLHMESIVLIRNINLYCVIVICNGHRWHVQ